DVVAGEVRNTTDITPVCAVDRVGVAVLHLREAGIQLHDVEVVRTPGGVVVRILAVLGGVPGGIAAKVGAFVADANSDRAVFVLDAQAPQAVGSIFRFGTTVVVEAVADHGFEAAEVGRQVRHGVVGTVG